jgi:hypothetical protein
MGGGSGEELQTTIHMATWRKNLSQYGLGNW